LQTYFLPRGRSLAPLYVHLLLPHLFIVRPGRCVG
jgi:hypothetical protein